MGIAIPERRMEDPRLGRIEAKIDEMTKALQGLIRVEERQAHHSIRMDRLELRVTDLESKELEHHNALLTAKTDRQNATKNRERIYWFIALLIPVAILVLEKMT